MSLPRPILDDRSYQQLRDELVRRIPVYNPEWTDHNASDPGITLVELFAFLGENLLFRFNQIPETTRLAFLDLLDVPLHPAQPAHTLLALSGKDPAGTLVPQGSPASAGEVAFETEDEALVFPIEVLPVAKRCEAPPAKDTEADDAATNAKLAAGVDEATQQAVFYRSQLFAAEPAAPGTEPVDLACTVDGALWVAVLKTDESPDAKLIAGKTLNLGVLIDGKTFGLDQLSAAPDACPACRAAGAVEPPRSASTRIREHLRACPMGSDLGLPDLLWHCSTPQLDAKQQPVYRALTIEADSTRSLTRNGVVRISLPDQPVLGTVAPGDLDAAGTGTFPPRLEDDALQARVLFWIRATRRNPAEPMPALWWVGVNAVGAVQTRKALTSFLGTGTGQPSQRYRLLHAPVLPRTAVLQVEHAGAFEPWAEVSSFDASSESSAHYQLDPASGTVQFGDGVRGRAPQLGERIRAVSYRWGGGAQGNIPAKGINRLDQQPSLAVANPMRAEGGSDSEELVKALERVPAELRRRDRAVTESDFAELALATPGADVGRAETLARFYPPLFKSETPGVVTVVVWPRVDRRNPDAPMPERGLLDQVCAHLDSKRLITTELWVIPPSYVQVAASLGLRIKPGFGIEAVRQWVEKVVRQYLAPLPPYGPEGNGWPLGRAVDARELVAAALQVEGVQFVEGVTLSFRAASGAWTRVSDARPVVSLMLWQLPQLTSLTVVEGPPLDPGAALEPPAPPRIPVPIPVIREEC